MPISSSPAVDPWDHDTQATDDDTPSALASLRRSREPFPSSLL